MAVVIERMLAKRQVHDLYRRQMTETSLMINKSYQTKIFSKRKSIEITCESFFDVFCTPTGILKLNGAYSFGVGSVWVSTSLRSS